MKDPHPEVRATALDAIAYGEDRRFLPLVKPLLADPHPDVRECAAEAMEELNDD